MTTNSVSNCQENTPMRFEQFLLPNAFKSIGLFIVIVSFIALIANRFTLESLDFKFLAKYAILLGMLLICISKEKVEDELISNLRMQSFTVAFIFGIIMSLLEPYAGYFLDLAFNSKEAILEDTSAFVILWMLLSVKVLYFNSLKRFHK